jgi:NAD(P)-dependent dehydrogenase (short-subunit alcohol dehydrogenase family)
MKKNILITGAQGALGGHVTERFLKEGYDVTGTLLKGEKVRVANQASWVEVDLTRSSSVQSALDGKTYSTLVHCAGGFRFATVADTTDEDLDFLINTNLRSTFYLLRSLLPGMKKNNFGRIVLISARATLQPAAGLAAYEASKAGLNMIVASLTEELKDFDITVNAVLPSIIDTPANRSSMPKADFSKWVRPEQLAEIIFSLTQGLGAPIRGGLIPVYGNV